MKYALWMFALLLYLTRQASSKVHGGWSSWSVYFCSQSCGGGTRNKFRSCNNPRPQSGGLFCLKIYGGRAQTEEISEACNTHSCIGGWSRWSTSACSKTCGVGVRTKSRVYIYSERRPTYSVTESCNLRNCPDPGKWSPWNTITCTATCGGGIFKEYRNCREPGSGERASDCLKADGISGNYEEKTSTCGMQMCAVNGNWGEWKWNTCSQSCGGGNTTRFRKCNNPFPSHGGETCLKKNGERNNYEEVISPCNIHECLEIRAVDGDGDVNFVVKLPVFKGDMSNYDIIVTELGDKKDVPRSRPDSYTVDDIQNNVDGLYVAGRVSDKDMFGKEIVVGRKGRDRRSLPDVDLKPLKRDTYYGVFVRGYISSTIYESSAWYPPIRMASISDSSDKPIEGNKVSLDVIVPVVLTIVLLVIIAFIVAFTCYHEKKPIEKPSNTSSGVTGNDNMSFNTDITGRPDPTAPPQTLKHPILPDNNKDLDDRSNPVPTAPPNSVKRPILFDSIKDPDDISNSVPSAPPYSFISPLPSVDNGDPVYAEIGEKIYSVMADEKYDTVCEDDVILPNLDPTDTTNGTEYVNDNNGNNKTCIKSSEVRQSNLDNTLSDSQYADGGYEIPKYKHIDDYIALPPIVPSITESEVGGDTNLGEDNVEPIYSVTEDSITTDDTLNARADANISPNDQSDNYFVLDLDYTELNRTSVSHIYQI